MVIVKRDHVISGIDWSMIVLFSAEFDCVIGGNTSGWATQCCITILVTHPIGRRFIFSFGCIQKSIVSQVRATASIGYKTKIGFFVNGLKL